MSDTQKLRLTEAAKIAGLGVSAMRYHIAVGNLKAEKPNARLLLVDRAELDAFMAVDRTPGVRKEHIAAMTKARWGDAASKSAKRKKAEAKPAGVGPAHLPGEPIIPPGVKVQRIPTPPPRFAVVDLPNFTASTASTRVLLDR